MPVTKKADTLEDAHERFEDAPDERKPVEVKVDHIQLLVRDYFIEPSDNTARVLMSKTSFDDQGELIGDVQPLRKNFPGPTEFANYLAKLTSSRPNLQILWSGADEERQPDEERGYGFINEHPSHWFATHVEQRKAALKAANTPAGTFDAAKLVADINAS